MTKKKAIKILGPALGYTDLLDHFTTKKLEKSLEEGATKYHPLRPSASGQCERQLTMKLIEYRGGEKFPKSVHAPAIDRLFKLGHSVEFSALRNFQAIEGLTQRYKQQTLDFFELKRGKKSLPTELVEGSCDVVFYTKKFRGIGDVKSKKDAWSNCYKTRWEEDVEKLRSMDSTVEISPTAFFIDDLPAYLEELGENFSSDNFYQLNLYANSKFMKDRGIDHAFLYYYYKNTSQHYEIRFKPSDEIFNRVKDKFNRISVNADKGVIPEQCDFTAGTMRFAFCDCHDMKPYFRGDGKKEWFATWPKKKWPSDLDRLDDTAELRQLFDNYQDLEDKMSEKDRTELNIARILSKQKCNKVKLDNGDVYDLKYLKSPRPHYALRKGKL